MDRNLELGVRDRKSADYVQIPWLLLPLHPKLQEPQQRTRLDVKRVHYDF